jgi:hypothetical protein
VKRWPSGRIRKASQRYLKFLRLVILNLFQDLTLRTKNKMLNQVQHDTISFQVLETNSQTVSCKNLMQMVVILNSNTRGVKL